MVEDLLIVAVFWVLFIVWVAYLWLVRNEIKRHGHAISTAAFFLVVMTFVYWMIFF